MADSSGSSGDHKNCFILVSGGREVGGGLRVEKFLLLCRISVSKALEAKSMQVCYLWRNTSDRCYRRDNMVCLSKLDVQ